MLFFSYLGWTLKLRVFLDKLETTRLVHLAPKAVY